MKKVLMLSIVCMFLIGCTSNLCIKKDSKVLINSQNRLILTQSFVDYEVVRIYKDKIEPVLADKVVNKHINNTKDFIKLNGIQDYTELGNLFYDEVIYPVTLKVTQTLILSNNLEEINNAIAIYNAAVIDPIYVSTTVTEKFNLKEFDKSMLKLKKAFMERWNNIPNQPLNKMSLNDVKTYTF